MSRVLEINVTIKKKRIKRNIFLFVFVILTISLVGFGIYKIIEFNNEQSKLLQSDISSIQSKLYKSPGVDSSYIENEAINSTLPYSQTTWKVIVNRVYYYQMEYPTNTTGFQKNIDGSTIWLLRRDGYIFKLNIFQYSGTPDQYINSIENIGNYAISKTTFNGQSALMLTDTNNTDKFKGNEIVLKYKGNMFVIWFLQIDKNTHPNDYLREQVILSNFGFI